MNDIFDTTMMRTWDSSLEFVPVCSRQLVKLPLFLVANELLFWLPNSNRGRNGRVARGEDTTKFGDHPREQLPNIKIKIQNLENFRRQKSFTLGMLGEGPSRREGRPDCSLAWIFVGHHQQYSSTLSRIGRSRTGKVLPSPIEAFGAREAEPHVRTILLTVLCDISFVRGRNNSYVVPSRRTVN